MALEIEKISETIQSLPLKDALAFLASQKIFEFAGEQLKKIKKIIQDKYNEGKYAFVPDKDEAQKLLQFSEDPSYKEVLLLVPRYRHIDILRTGLLIDSYHKRNEPRDRERVLKIKDQINRRPNGSYLIKIANLPTTPFFSGILHHLYELKRRGYSEKQLEESLDEMVTFWETSSLFVKNEHSKEEVVSFCEKQMSQQKPALFLLGMREAAKKVENAIEKLRADKLLEKYNYEYKIVKSEEGNHPRVEVTLRKIFTF